MCTCIECVGDFPEPTDRDLVREQHPFAIAWMFDGEWFVALSPTAPATVRADSESRAWALMLAKLPGRPAYLPPSYIA